MKLITTTNSRLFFFLCLFMSIGTYLQAQTVTVKGFVLAEDEPDGLIGVNVLVKETLKGTATDFDGTFELSIEQSILPVTLQFSYTGYEDQEIIVAQAEPNLRVTMVSGAETLDLNIEVKGQRVDEKKKASALTVESLDGIAIKQTASSNFYDGLGALKGVEPVMLMTVLN